MRGRFKHLLWRLPADDVLQSFGSVNQILRMPNGDLHVHFQSGEVADTVTFLLDVDVRKTNVRQVCRLRAKVFITGVGSVQLSFLTGGK